MSDAPRSALLSPHATNERDLTTVVGVVQCDPGDLHAPDVFLPRAPFDESGEGKRAHELEELRVLVGQQGQVAPPRGLGSQAPKIDLRPPLALHRHGKVGPVVATVPPPYEEPR